MEQRDKRCTCMPVSILPDYWCPLHGAAATDGFTVSFDTKPEPGMQVVYSSEPQSADQDKSIG